MPSTRTISIVIPVYEEADSIEALVAEIVSLREQVGHGVEAVLIDDGSRDGSWQKIKAAAEAHDWIGGISFKRNAGKAAALMAGFAAARGEIVATLDGDGQDPPGEIPRLLERIDAGSDLVSGWKRHRKDAWHKVLPSRVFNRLIGVMTGVHLHDHVCGLKCMRAEVARDFHLYGEMHRFLGVFAAAHGYAVGEVETLHRPRTVGRSKYGFTRFFKGFLDLITVWFLTRYRWRPQHVLGVAGLTVTLSTALMYATVQWGWRLPALVRWPVLTLTGLVMLLSPLMVLGGIGLVGELIVASRPANGLYQVAERVGWCREANNKGKASHG